MKDMLNRIFDKLSPYVPGEQPREEGFIKLNTNENPFPPPKKVLDEIKRNISSKMILYPDPQSIELRKVIGDEYGFSHEWIFVGNGSDEILRLCIYAFSNIGEKIVFPYPSYPLYETLAVIAERQPQKIILNKDFTVPYKFISKFTNCLKFIANPDSPSGIFHPVEFIEEAVKKNKRVFIIDEAYADFATGNCLHLVKKYSNVIVTRSFSKSFSLAGIRLGYCFGKPELISALVSIKDSYNVNSITQIAGISAIKNIEYVRKNCSKIIKNRQWLKNELEKLNFYVFSSSANFLLVIPPGNKAKSLYEFLKKRRILVRYFSNIPELESSLRITIGTRKQLLTMIDCIKRFYGYC
ncbi:MAG: histidinol-phosphate transaminase [Candidatus Omnitrophica bacterium]|nr:histidinol-phosphate transaminase [Candidatus Omnitrophota bacterium]MCM8816194.1 histidinol-phosphate transaminase [Candidatus Omnitrophota bacterium]